METFNTVTGERLRAVMDRQGWTIVRLARAAGVSKNTILDLRNRPQKKPQARTLEVVAAQLGVDPAWLAGAPGGQSGGAKGGAEPQTAKDFPYISAIWETLEGVITASNGRLRVYHSPHDWPALGIPAGAVIVVDCGADPRSGTVCLICKADGTMGLRYIAEPYMIGQAATGQLFHEVFTTPETVLGQVIATTSRL